MVKKEGEQQKDSKIEKKANSEIIKLLMNETAKESVEMTKEYLELGKEIKQYFSDTALSYGHTSLIEFLNKAVEYYTTYYHYIDLLKAKNEELAEQVIILRKLADNNIVELKKTQMIDNLLDKCIITDTNPNLLLQLLMKKGGVDINNGYNG